MAFKYLTNYHMKELNQEWQNQIPSQSRQTAQAHEAPREVWGPQGETCARPPKALTLNCI